MQEFDGVFDGDDVIGAGSIDAIDHGRESGGFARAGCPGDQHQAALLLANAFHDVRKIQLFNRANLRGNYAEHHADVAALLENVDAKTAQARDAVGHVQFRGFLKLLLLTIGHHAERHGKHFFRSDARNVGERRKRAIDTQTRMVSNF